MLPYNIVTIVTQNKHSLIFILDISKAVLIISIKLMLLINFYIPFF